MDLYLRCLADTRDEASVASNGQPGAHPSSTTAAIETTTSTPPPPPPATTTTTSESSIHDTTSIGDTTTTPAPPSTSATPTVPRAARIEAQLDTLVNVADTPRALPSIVFQIIWALTCAQRQYAFVHNDFHLKNILVSIAPPAQW
jgi:hypothetical protein